MTELLYPAWWKRPIVERSINFVLDKESMSISALGMVCLSPNLVEGYYVATHRSHQMPGAFWVGFSLLATFLFSVAVVSRIGAGDSFEFRRVKPPEPVVPAQPVARTRASQPPEDPSLRLLADMQKAGEENRRANALPNIATSPIIMSVLAPG